MKILEEVLYFDFQILPENAEKFVYASALITRKDESLKELIEKIIDEKSIENFIKTSIEAGHASVSTHPIACGEFYGSRVLDYYLSSSTWGSSYLIYSQRVIRPSKEDILIPTKIVNSGYEKEFLKTSINQFETYENLLERDKSFRNLEKARRVIGFQFPSRGSFVLTLQALANIVNGIDYKDKFVPNELKVLKNKVIEKSKNNRLLSAILNSPGSLRITREIFYNPEYSFVSKIAERENFPEYMILEEKLLDENLLSTILEDLGKKEEKYRDKIIKEIEIGNFENAKKYYNDFSRKLAYDIPFYNLYSVTVLIKMSLAMFNEFKRHRTIKMIPESIYNAVKRREFYVPKAYKGKEELEDYYINSLNNSVDSYEKLVEDGAEISEAIYLVPQGLQIYVIADFDLSHLLLPFNFYKIRNCFTAEEEIQNFARKLPTILRSSKYKVISKDLVEKHMMYNDEVKSKCQLGICPEKNYCEIVFKFNKKYNKEIHERLRRIYLI
ncbi:MAG: FAD-dependent thymidylate synthase [Candidatus Aenigmatarchaeota archaeon]